MPSALLHQQIALLELDHRLREAERRHRLFRPAEVGGRDDATTRRSALRAVRRAGRRAAAPQQTTAPVIDLPAAPASTTMAARGDHASSPARVA